jgi:hypothetical protein
MKKNPLLPVIAGFILILIATMGGWLYYNLTVRNMVLENLIDKAQYEKHYVLISDEQNKQFWREMYEAASQAAREQNAYLEFMQNDISTNYTTDEFLKMSIAAKVDGIIMKHTGTQETIDLINAAAKNEIPVVTVIEDAPQSRRVSFVGENNYLSGQIYGEQILQIMDEDTKKITVLTNGELEQSRNIHTQINTTLVKNGYTEGEIIVEIQDLGAKGVFDVENVIRNIVLMESIVPDILICMDEISTESAYQAVIDYNLVGITKIIGYYASDMVIEGLEQGVIPVIFELKADQIGAKSIEALAGLSEDGRTNEYYTIEMSIINKNNIEEYVKNNGYEENE